MMPRAMDLQVVTMPKLGESVTEGTITAWLKSVGDRVELDDPLFEVSTDKVDSEIPSAFEGTLLEILVPEGETVGVDTPIARIGPAEAAGAAPAPPPTTGEQTGPAFVPAGEAAMAPAPTPALATVGAPTVAPAPPGGGNGGRAMVSPVVRRLAAEHSIDTATVQGTGEGGRIMREDIEGAIAAGTPGLTPTPAQAPAAAPAPGPASAPAAKPAAPAATDSRAEVQPLSRIRLVTAERMVESKRISPHVWTSIEVDLERVEETRQRHKDRFRKEEGVGLTYLAFIARAVCDALRAFPAMNSSVDIEAKTQTFHRYVNLGIAVDLDGKGLVAPVIRDADSLNLRGMARAIRQKADGAHAGRLAPDDYSGSTFTITNPGPFGDYASAPIINQPNVGILSTNMVSRRPTVVGNAIAIHHMTILGISYDHRAIDGVAVSQFLRHIKDALEQRDWEAELG